MAASRKRSIVTCSFCMSPLQDISEQPENGEDDLYCMSSSPMPDIINTCRSKCPTQTAIELQTSMPCLIFPSIVWLKSGRSEGRVHERLRAFRVAHAPSREYFKIPIKRGSDFMEQVLYAPDTSQETHESHESHEMRSHQIETRCNNRRKVVMCARYLLYRQR